MTADMTQNYLPLTEAAAALGLSREALRLRVRRNRVAAVKVGGVWHVQVGHHRHGLGQTMDTTPVMSTGQTADMTQDSTPDSELVALRAENHRLLDELGFLRRELENRTEEIRRRDHIIAALAQRPGQLLPAPHEAPAPPAAAPARRAPWWRFWDQERGTHQDAAHDEPVGFSETA